MRKSVLTIAVVVSLASSAFAQFEGVIDMKMSSKQGGGTVKTYVGKAGVRSEMRMEAGGVGIYLVTLVKAGEPDTAYRLNDEDKTYSVVDLKAARGAAKGGGKCAVEKLGAEKVKGYDTVHVKVTSAGETSELWTTKQVGDLATYSRAMGKRSGVDDACQQALKDAGADGFPVKTLSRGPNGETVTVELVSVSAKAPAAALFQVPAGYKKVTAHMPHGTPGMSPEMKKQMKDAMQGVTPEQIEMMEKMMKEKGR
jgi:hypothetical protein